MSLYNVGRVGELRLEFEQRQARTALTVNYSRPPLQVMRAIKGEGNSLCVYLLSPTGGVVQGDRYFMQIRAGAGTHALCTTQSATRVYKMPDGCAEQHIRIDIEADAVFEFIPDATILFADSDFSQHIDVTLQPGALLFLHEIVMPGRLARGERMLFRRYANRLVVRDAEGLILYDAATLQPSRGRLDTVGVLEGYDCWGSAYLLGDLANYGIDATAFCQVQQPLFKREGALGALSPLHRNGIGVRLLSHRLETIYTLFHQLRQVIRTQYLHLPEAALRKY